MHKNTTTMLNFSINHQKTLDLNCYYMFVCHTNPNSSTGLCKLTDLRIKSDIISNNSENNFKFIKVILKKIDIT